VCFSDEVSTRAPHRVAAGARYGRNGFCRTWRRLSRLRRRPRGDFVAEDAPPPLMTNILFLYMRMLGRGAHERQKRLPEGSGRLIIEILPIKSRQDNMAVHRTAICTADD